MRVILFCWEYPPRIVGRLAEYVNALAIQLAKNRIKPFVVTYHDSITGTSQDSNGVTTIRVSNPIRTHTSVLTWDLTLNQEVERAAANVYYQAGKQISLIDVYDWHFIPAAVTLKAALGIPFIYSVESLEDHRSPASNSAFNMAIRGIEWLGFYEAAHVTAKTDWMKEEIMRIYNVPQEKITIVEPTTPTWLKNVTTVYESLAEVNKT